MTSKIFLFLFVVHVMFLRMSAQNVDDQLCDERELTDDFYTDILTRDYKSMPCFQDYFKNKKDSVTLKRGLFSTKILSVLDFSKDMVFYNYNDYVAKYLVKADTNPSLYRRVRVAIVYYDNNLLGFFSQSKRTVYGEGDWYTDVHNNFTSYSIETYHKLSKVLLQTDSVFYCRPLGSFGTIINKRLFVFNREMELITVEEYVKNNYSSRYRFQDLFRRAENFDPVLEDSIQQEDNRRYFEELLIDAIFRSDTLKNSFNIQKYYSSFRTLELDASSVSVDIVVKAFKQEMKLTFPSISSDLLGKCTREYSKYFDNIKFGVESLKPDYLKKMKALLGNNRFTIWESGIYEWKESHQKVQRIKKQNELIVQLKNKLGYENLSNMVIVFSSDGYGLDEKREYYKKRKEIYMIPTLPYGVPPEHSKAQPQRAPSINRVNINTYKLHRK